VAVPARRQPPARRTSPVAITRLDPLNALAGLKAVRAQAVALRDLVGLGYSDIAVLQQGPEGTAKSRVDRARAQLRERVGPDLDATT
jgi:DNA-directed RNA polymerase specialized sigma24 family protein